LDILNEIRWTVLEIGGLRNIYGKINGLTGWNGAIKMTRE
jgi:hypothetical protein